MPYVCKDCGAPPPNEQIANAECHNCNPLPFECPVCGKGYDYGEGSMIPCRELGGLVHAVLFDETWYLHEDYQCNCSTAHATTCNKFE